MENRIDFYIKKSGATVEQVANRAGISRVHLSNMKAGRKGIDLDMLNKLAVALDCNPEDLIIKNSPKQIPIVGSVGAGSVDMVDCYLQGGGEDYVDAPYGLPSQGMVALRVKGNSQEPMLEDGWLIFYRRNHEGVPPDCIGRLCVVLLPDETIMVKKIKLGSQTNHYHLLSRNADTLVDQKLVWAARVLDIRPN